MMIMDEEDLSEEIKQALIDRFEGWELVELLDIGVEEIVEVFEVEIQQRLNDLLSVANIRSLSDDTDFGDE